MKIKFVKLFLIAYGCTSSCKDAVMRLLGFLNILFTLRLKLLVMLN